MAESSIVSASVKKKEGNLKTTNAMIFTYNRIHGRSYDIHKKGKAFVCCINMDLLILIVVLF